MLSCASPARMPSTPRGVHPQNWGNLLLSPPQIKSEPMEEGSFGKDQSNSFYSEGFHSTSPASSKESDLSPKSVDALNFYDNLPLNAKANLGLHLESRNGIPYNLLTHSSFDPTSKEDHNRSPTYDNSYSPKSLARPGHISVSTPITCEVNPPESSPIIPASPERDDRFQDSGFEGAQVKLLDGEDSRDDFGDDYGNEPGLNTPAVNSHGKVKTFKCKQCDYVAVTKLLFWEHSKEHIKPEKMLKCKKCPFVTEYKHHLEYHMRNHTGVKPFRCPKCSYACVNKSMLNSHLKSHSNVYQFRCADCNYATKYCHSLKLHLRKYQHKPDVVLNLDGTPNPLPIIDVYGTRRGPKQKPISALFETQSSHNLSNGMQPQHPPPTHPLFGGHFPVNLPYLPPILPHSFLFPPNNNYEHRTSPTLSDHADIQASSPSSMLQKRLTFGESIAEAKSPPAPNIPSQNPQTPTASRSITPPTNDDALDLSKINVTASPSPSPNIEQSTPVTPTTAMKNRRKGRAFKLQPAALRLQHEDENRASNASDTESDGSHEPAPGTTNKYVCQHCDITFGDNTMHAIHMGFHGFNDPFMCNKCGQRSADRLKFYLHLVTVQHS